MDNVRFIRQHAVIGVYVIMLFIFLFTIIQSYLDLFYKYQMFKNKCESIKENEQVKSSLLEWSEPVNLVEVK